jgi:hypothetical protein
MDEVPEKDWEGLLDMCNSEYNDFSPVHWSNALHRLSNTTTFPFHEKLDEICDSDAFHEFVRNLRTKMEPDLTKFTDDPREVTDIIEQLGANLWGRTEDSLAICDLIAKHHEWYINGINPPDIATTVYSFLCLASDQKVFAEWHGEYNRKVVEKGENMQYIENMAWCMNKQKDPWFDEDVHPKHVGEILTIAIKPFLDYYDEHMKGTDAA